MSIFIIIFVTTVLHGCHFIHDHEIIIVHFLGCRTITTFALTFAQLATCNIGLFSLQLHLRLLQGFWLQQPQNVTFSKLSGAIGVVESKNTGSTVLLVLSLTHPNCSTSSGTMSRLKFFQMLA